MVQHGRSPLTGGGDDEEQAMSKAVDDGSPARMLVAAFSMAALLAWSGVHAANGVEIAEGCDNCHGKNGHSTEEDVPSIGGFSEFGIMDLLESYRVGNREARKIRLADGREVDMNMIVQRLSEDDIEAVAVHYASQPWKPHQQEFDAALARRGAAVHDIKCDKCHSEGGSVKDDDLAIMSGQWRKYLEMEFDDFDTGTRKMADKMREKYDTLSAEDKQAIIELYVSAGNY